MDASQLSQKELFHFALYASKNQRTDESIIYLKEFLKSEPENPEAMFLIGSQYAELAMFDEGIEYMRQTLEIAPEAHLVRFQMSMLYFSLNKKEETLTGLAPLLEIEESDPFNRFAMGITALINGESSECIALLKQGLEIELNNPALVDNINNMIAAIEKREQSPESEDTEITTDEANAGEMFLSVYKK